MVKWIICALALVAVAYGRPNTNSNSPSTQQQFRPRIDCPRLGDGNYVFGCSSTFYQCANGVAHAQKCHSDMVLDPEQNACDIPAKVAICRPEAMQNPSVVRAKDPFTCVGKPVGMYFIGCNGAYAYCDGQGNRRDRSCPPGTALDESKDACDWSHKIPACSSSPSTKHSRRTADYAPVLPRIQESAPAGAPGYAPQEPIRQEPPAPQRPSQPYGGSQFTAPTLPRPTSNEPLIPAQSNTDDAPEFDCSSRKNGIYPSPIAGCVNFFWKCVNGQPFKYVCPEGLVFSVSHVECRRLDEITDCGVQRTSPLNTNEPLEWKPTLPQGQQIMTSQQSTSLSQQALGPYAQPIQQDAPRPIENWCQRNNRQDGYHGEGCSAYYFHCNAGLTLRLHCPAGLFFDAETQACDHKNLIPACGGQRPTQPPQLPQSPTLPPRPVENWCQQNNRQDGYHGEGCSAYYFHCNAGFTTRMHCPSGLFFDAETAACDHKNLIVACGGQKPTQPPQLPQSPTLAPQQPLSPYGQQQQQNPPRPIEDFCQKNNLINGFHGDGCNNYFFVCASGTTTRITCPAGLWYDIELQQCDRKEFIPACGGQRPTQPPQSPTLAPQQPLSPYGQQQQQSPPAPLFDCSGKADGIYVEGCTAQYFACNGGHAHALSCPAGTFYSVHTEGCDYREHIVACGGQAPTQAPPAQSPILLPQQPYQQFQPAAPVAPVRQDPTTPAPAWVAQPYQPAALPQQSPAATQPTQVESVNTNPCLSLSNGIYGRKCSRFFFVCTNSKTYDFICPKEQAFDVKTSKCAHKSLISTCPEFTQIPQTQQSPPVSQAVSPYGRRLY